MLVFGGVCVQTALPGAFVRARFWGETLSVRPAYLNADARSICKYIEFLYPDFGDTDVSFGKAKFGNAFRQGFHQVYMARTLTIRSS